MPSGQQAHRQQQQQQVTSVHGAYTFGMHAIDTRQIAWCVESSNSRGINRRFVGQVG